MNDSDAKHRMADYLEGNLSDDEAQQIEQCLETSETCRQELAYLKRVQDLISSKPPVTSPDLWSGISSRIAREESASVLNQFEWLGKRLVPILAAAAVVMFAIFGSSNTTDTDLTFEDYLKTGIESSEIVLLTSAEMSQDDVLYLLQSR